MAHDEPVTATIGPGEGIRTTLRTSLHEWVGDAHKSDDVPEPAGPNPFVQLLGALGSCMVMTVKLYAQRKGWDLQRVEAQLVGEREPARPLTGVVVRIGFEGDLTDEQRERLLDISGKCPVHKTLAPVVEITTEAITLV